MATETIHRPKKVAEITGVEPRTAENWRARGFLPPADGAWSNYSESDMCRVALLKQFSAQGVPLGEVTEAIPVFLPALEACLSDAHRGIDSGMVVGVYALWPKGRRAFVALDWEEYREALTSQYGNVHFLGFLRNATVNLVQVARQISDRMKKLAEPDPDPITRPAAARAAALRKRLAAREREALHLLDKIEGTGAEDDRDEASGPS